MSVTSNTFHSSKEAFLRDLIRNALDALDKVHPESSYEKIEASDVSQTFGF